MYICQWSLQIVFGKQKQALDIMKEWGAEKFRSSRFSKSKSRVCVGHIGESPSLVIDEYEFENLDDFTMALGEMGQPQFKQYSEAMAPLIIPGTQKWKVFRVVGSDKIIDMKCNFFIFHSGLCHGSISGRFPAFRFIIPVLFFTG
ncbi:MAG: hypothetical protein IPO53_13010 [Chitinophagaceae bacterium]|nr:hypothetical protein [Chitinophagaceae bacterium]